MLSNDEIRDHLGRPDMPDKEADALRTDLYAWLNRALDEYFAAAHRGET